MSIKTMNTLKVSRRRLLTGGLTFGAMAGLAASIPPAAALTLGAPRQDFGPIHRIVDAGRLSPLEQDHAPRFWAPDMTIAGATTALSVAVGRPEHPMEGDHYIHRLRVTDEAGHVLTDMALRPDHPQAGCEIYVKVERTTTFVAQVFCNQHGIFEARHQITV